MKKERNVISMKKEKSKAEIMFEELGFKKYEKSDFDVEYKNENLDIIFFEQKTFNICFNPMQEVGIVTLGESFLKAIYEQMKELGVVIV